MTAVRRLVLAAGLAGVLSMAAAGSAWADPTPSADPSATASPVASPTASADPSATPAPTDSPSAEPTAGGCDANPEICQSGGAPNTTTDCGQVGPGGQPASPPPPGTVCIAGGLNNGNPNEVTPVSAGSGSPGTLPRTGPAPLVPTLALGGWLLLIGMVAVLAGRRRTARI